MSTPIEERFVTRPDVAGARHSLDTSIAALGRAVAELSPSVDGALYVVKEKHYPDDVGVISHWNAPRLSKEQATFAKRNIFNRRIQLTGTALEQSLEDRSPLFTQSAMQPERHMTWGAGLGNAAVQIAFDVRNGTLPSNDEMGAIWEHHAPLIAEASLPLQRIQDETKNFLGKMELDPATQPNAFAIRWDITGSTEMALTKSGPYQAYLDHWKREITRVMERSDHDVFDLGDGQNLILPFGRNSPFDTSALRRMRDTIVLPLTNALIATHEHVATQYDGTLAPKARFAVSMGNVYPDDSNQKTGLLLYEAARSLKRPEGVLTISPSAKLN